MDELDTLARRAGERAREHARARSAHYGVDDVAARSARGRRTTLLAGAGATVAVLLLVAVLLVADLRVPGTVTIEPVAPGGDAVVEIPPEGSAEAVHLADGTPVFVSHPTDDDVVVLDATNPHLGDKLVAFCLSSGWFEDLYHGSRFNGWGDYTAGPTPAGLPAFPYALLDGERLRVTGPPGEAPARDEPRGEQQSPRGPSCLDDFSDAVIHTPRDEVPVLDPDQLPQDRWVWARLVVGGTDANPVVCNRDGNCPAQAPAAPDLVPYEPDQSDRTPTEGLWLAHRTSDNTVLLRKPAQPDLHDPTPLVTDEPPQKSNQEAP